ncbi:MAG: zinc metallopeptidase [Clostridia bacterium]|nr:zinc metallopeptidase [Clostridia bacterium]MBR4013996.1 zinc metallopeptidase [Clostridia bacterium]
MLFGLFRFDWTILIVLPALFISIWAQIKVSSTYHKYSSVRTKRNVTGYAAARAILDANGLHYVKIEHVRGHLTDHYDPRANVIRLSDSVYGSDSAAAVGVAAHEAGHAVQYAQDYAPIKLRMAIIPVTRFGSMLAIPLFFIGLILASDLFMLFGIVLYSAVALFQLVTLPVEFNASARALRAIDGAQILTNDELAGAKRVLSAAAMTYVAALLTSLLTLLRLLVLAGGRSNRR